MRWICDTLAKRLFIWCYHRSRRKRTRKRRSIHAKVRKLHHPTSFSWVKEPNDTQRPFSQIEKKALTIVTAVEGFRKFIFKRKFTLKTDHRPTPFRSSKRKVETQEITSLFVLNQQTTLISKYLTKGEQEELNLSLLSSSVTWFYSWWGSTMKSST